MLARRLVAPTVVVALVVSACSTLGGSASSRTTTTAKSTTSTTVVASATPTTSPSGFAPSPVQWANCGGRLKCATVKVPLDYANPSGPRIDVAINESPARKPSERIGVLLVNPGGPGGSGLDFVASGLDVSATILDRFDVIGFDPRGVGKSSPLQCGDATVPAFRHVDSMPDTPAEQTALEAAAKAVADDCGQHAGPLLTHVGTDDVVRDMDTIRQALGEQQINYLGISYGTLLGLRFAQLFPHSARAITIDGVVDPTQDFSEFLRQQTIAYQKAIDVVFDGCPDGGSGCPPGGARAAYDELARRVETDPVPGSGGDVLGTSELVTAALIPTYEPSAASVFYSGLTDALRGDGNQMLRLTHAYDDVGSYPDYAGVECTDTPHPPDVQAFRAFAQELAGISPRFGAAIANELLPCVFWPAPTNNIAGPITAPDSPPMLVIGTTGDAATPYQQAVAVAKTLAHGRLLTFQSEGHSSYAASSCTSDAEGAYFVDLTLPPEGTTCTK
ncbi:MAG TPA: alpha/beta hydrolase [Acidimicrobiales bacterium]|jgi:pimeloyl-ACP methyl ester carboxylesterase|nr:alpha/beta hydrolase [Acidimicrobiales bacterium]